MHTSHTYLAVVLFVCLQCVISRLTAVGSENQFVPYTQAAQPKMGTVWPADQALPTFAAPADPLYAIDVQSLSVDERITFSALQGQVNRKKPRILLLDSRADEGRDTWPDTSTIQLPPRRLVERTDRYQLVVKFADELAGVVLYDPQVSPHFRNLAGTVAAINHALPVTAEVFRNMRQQRVNFDVVADLTKLRLSSPVEIYTHLYTHYWSRCNKRLLVSAKPDRRGGDHHHTRDMAAACGAAVVWLDCRIPAERMLLQKFLGEMNAGNAVVLGWYSTERSGVTTASRFGIGTMPADHFISSTVYSGTDHHIQIPTVPQMPSLRHKAYVAIFMSDGDNIQYTQRAMRKIWDAALNSRGKVALNWTIAPGLVDVAPGILNYYYTTATPNDCFVTGPSGLGYLMPVNTLEEPGAPVGVTLQNKQTMANYARLTETYLQRAGLRAITIWDEATPMQRAAYERHCRNLYGATVQNFRDMPSVASSVEGQRVRFEKLVTPYAGSYRHLRRSLARELTKRESRSPCFLAFQVAIWNELKPVRIVDLYEDIRTEFPGQVEFVRADHFFNLYNQAHGLPFNLCLSPETSVKTSGDEVHAGTVMDGSVSTEWHCTVDGSEWLEFDFGKSYNLERYVVRWTRSHNVAGGRDAGRPPVGCSVQTSVDGLSWQTVDRHELKEIPVLDVDLADVVKGRYLRVVVDNLKADFILRIGDVEVYGATTVDR